jgi:molybdopterin synthase catalytic subunit
MAKQVKNIFVEGPVPAQRLTEEIQKHADKYGIGAHSVFLGQVRADEKQAGKVKAIEYTAYTEMALEQMHVIREELFAKYPITCLHVYHSLGMVPAGGLSLLVFVSSPHRKAAFDACEELVEAIKFRLPVWGKEILDTDTIAWKENN